MATQTASTLRKVLARCVNTKMFDRLLDKVKVVEASPGRCVCEMTVAEEHTNLNGGLHGGYTALLVDKITTLALLSNPDGVGGVSVDMNISYLSSAKIGDDIIIDARTEKFGKTLAFLKAEIRHKEHNKIIATGTHTKFVGGR